METRVSRLGMGVSTQGTVAWVIGREPNARRRVFRVLQIKYLQHICHRYLQHCNYLVDNTLVPICCRWQMFRTFYSWEEIQPDEEVNVHFYMVMKQTFDTVALQDINRRA